MTVPQLGEGIATSQHDQGPGPHLSDVIRAMPHHRGRAGIDVGDQPCRLSGAHAEEQVTTSDQQLVAELERLGDVATRLVGKTGSHTGEHTAGGPRSVHTESTLQTQAGRMSLGLGADRFGRVNHRPGGTSSGSPKLESSSGPRKVVISAIPSPSSVSTEMLRGRKLCRSSSQR